MGVLCRTGQYHGERFELRGLGRRRFVADPTSAWPTHPSLCVYFPPRTRITLTGGEFPVYCPCSCTFRGWNKSVVWATGAPGQWKQRENFPTIILFQHVMLVSRKLTSFDIKLWKTHDFINWIYWCVSNSNLCWKGLRLFLLTLKHPKLYEKEKIKNPQECRPSNT